ncbi:TetR/AcrR family transcriptional regulator [Microbacterium sp. ZW T2_14]|uniref:TetR/AcrR family transcriptional regulator n=1 Tax=Microbacterium sp. ZW T2_14 TaxID=3378079 RepID=UPI003853FCC8
MATDRKTADTRRARAVDAGLRAFADHGMTTAAVQDVAKQIGVSQPYVFRLFGSKRAFFLACLDELEARVVAAFSSYDGHAGDLLEEMGATFRSLVSDGTAGGFWLQACVAAQSDSEIAARCRELISDVLRLTSKVADVDADRLAAFLGRGALVTMLQALGVDLAEGSAAAVRQLSVSGTTP